MSSRLMRNKGNKPNYIVLQREQHGESIRKTRKTILVRALDPHPDITSANFYQYGDLFSNDGKCFHQRRISPILVKIGTGDLFIH